MRGFFRRQVLLPYLAVIGLCVFAIPASAGEEEEVFELVEGTAVLLDITSAPGSSGGGGNGGNSKTTSSSTHIFAPAAYADYKRFGGEPTVTLDRYPFAPGFVCPPTAVIDPCPKRDISYVSAPNGFVFPRYSQFYVSDDLGQSYRKPAHLPIHGLAAAQGEGGGDSHKAVGQDTHFLYFVDLAFDCITMNVSEDFGQTFRTDDFGCGLAFLDDRQWVEADEAVNRVYISTINLINLVFPTLAAFLNTTGAPAGGFIANSTCNEATFLVGGPGTEEAPAAGETPCPDPSDQFLWVAGPIVADNEGNAQRPTPTHHVYIPFIRRIASDPLGTGIFGIDEWQLWIAKSVNDGETWTRHHVATRPAGNNPANIFPELTIDRNGNLYYTWSETQGGPTESTQTTRRDREQKQSINEQDCFYAYSTGGGLAGTWSSPINLTKEAGDSCIFPWMVAGDDGRVDATFYKANSGLNSNIPGVDAEGEPCTEEEVAEEECPPNPSVWNTYFAQSMNALNPGPNFNTVQVTPQPNHIGQICTSGLSCEGDRDLLDFITVEVDSRGAAHIAYSDDNRRRSSDTQDLVTRQISGNSVFKDQNITLANEWPIRNHAVTDRMGDVYDTAGMPKDSCPGMDVLATSVERKDDLITVNLTLNSPPTAAAAAACGGVLPALTTTGGLWGAEFWAAADPGPPANTGPSNRFYIAYRDNPPDGQPRVEGGTMDHVNLTVTSLDFNDRTQTGTLGGDCFTDPAPAPCTISLTLAASSLGITPGNGLYNITGISTYLFGNLEDPIPLTRVVVGNSEQADATAPFHYLGSGTP
jgi:hypothetical protein